MRPHGTTTRYTQYGCRCDDCRAAHNAYCRGYQPRWRALKKAQQQLRSMDEPDHGTVIAYEDYGCRCEPCLTRMVEVRRERLREYKREWAKQARIRLEVA